MKPPPLRYVRPESVAAATEQLAAAEGDAKALAGGQSLLPLLNLRMARPAVLVDIGRLAAIDFIAERDGALVIGAATKQRTIELSPLVRRLCPLLVQALRHVGHLQIRNRGTIGGSLAHADPAAELPCAAVALDATLTVIGPRGTRQVAAADFFVGPFITELTETEILTEITIPVSGASAAFTEFARRHGDFAMVGVAAVCGRDPATGLVSQARLVTSGVGPAPHRLTGAEGTLLGGQLTPAAIGVAADTAAAEVDPWSDAQADAGYRRKLVAALVTRALEDLRS